MTEHGAGDYKDLVVFLAAAGVMVPLFNRFKVSPVLGFLAAGVLLGPFGLARFADAVPSLTQADLFVARVPGTSVIVTFLRLALLDPPAVAIRAID